MGNTRIENLHKTEAVLLDLAEGLILIVIVIDPLKKVLHSGLFVHFRIVWAINLDLPDVGFNNIRIVAERFDEKEFVAHLIYDDFSNELTPFVSRIRRIKYLFF